MKPPGNNILIQNPLHDILPPLDSGAIQSQIKQRTFLFEAILDEQEAKFERRTHSTLNELVKQ